MGLVKWIVLFEMPRSPLHLMGNVRIQVCYIWITKGHLIMLKL